MILSSGLDLRVQLAAVSYTGNLNTELLNCLSLLCSVQYHTASCKRPIVHSYSKITKFVGLMCLRLLPAGRGNTARFRCSNGLGSEP